jgi:hypothetical protein
MLNLSLSSTARVHRYDAASSFVPAAAAAVAAAAPTILARW